LAGESISRPGRIVAIADAFEVMTAIRSYKTAIPATAAREELTRCAGSHFDPTLVRAFLNISLGDLRTAIGPLAWLAEFPAIRTMGNLAGSAVTTAAQGIVTLAVIVGLTAAAQTDPPQLVTAR